MKGMQVKLTCGLPLFVWFKKKQQKQQNVYLHIYLTIAACVTHSENKTLFKLDNFLW